MDSESQIYTLLALLQTDREALERIIKRATELLAGQAKEKTYPQALCEAAIDAAMDLEKLTAGQYDWASVVSGIAERLQCRAHAIAAVDPNHPEVSRLQTVAAILEIAPESTEIRILGRFDVEERED
jgi:hypothetical protein